VHVVVLVLTKLLQPDSNVVVPVYAIAQYSQRLLSQLHALLALVHTFHWHVSLQVRAGESESEAQDVILTNPAWKTSMAAGLSERGKAQVSKGVSCMPRSAVHTHPCQHGSGTCTG